MAKKSAHGEMLVLWTKDATEDGDGVKRVVAFFSDGKLLTKATQYKGGKVDGPAKWKLGNAALFQKDGITPEDHALALSKCKAFAGFVVDTQATQPGFLRVLTPPKAAEAAKPTAPEATGNGSSENVTKCDVCGKEHKGFTTGRGCSVKDCPGTVRAPKAPKAAEKPVEAHAAKSTALVPCRGTCDKCETSIKMPSTDGLTVTCQFCKKGTVTFKALNVGPDKAPKAAPTSKADKAPKAATKDEKPATVPAPDWAPPDGAWTVGDLLRALGVSKIDPLANRTRLTVGINDDLSTVFGISFGQFEALDGHSYYAMTLEGKLPKDLAPQDDHAVTTGNTLPFPAAKGNTAGTKKGKK